MKLYLTLPLILILVFLLPLRPVQNFRNDLAYHAIKSDFVTTSKLLSRYGKWQKDPLATNNWLILDYYDKRYDPSYSKDEKRQNTKIVRDALKAMRPARLAVSEYNLALFNYKCKTTSICFDIGVERFETAENLGDPLAKNALLLMHRRKLGKGNQDKRLSVLKLVADNGDPYASYQYARSIYHDDPITAQNYALVAATAGIADAQAFLGNDYFGRIDSEDWLKQAALNKLNRSIRAASLLAEKYEAEGKTKKAVKWYKRAIEPRDSYRHQLVIRKDGLRWRSLQSTRSADVNNSNSAAYKLALLQGEAGTDEPKSNSEKHSGINSENYSGNMRKASLVGWGDSELIMAQLAYQDAPGHAKKMQTKNLTIANLKYFDSSSYGKSLTPLRPMIASGDIRYVTELDLSKWEDEMRRNKNEALEFVKENYDLLKRKCKAARKCFLVNKAINLPAGMNGAHSAVFVIPETVKAPRVGKSHNKYIFLGLKHRQINLDD